jgi:type I restriction enzyme S subunit
MTMRTVEPLGKFIDVKHGYAFESKYFTDAGPFRLLTPGNFAEAGGFIDRGDRQKCYDGPVPSDFVLEPGSLLVAMTEQAEGLLGSTAFVPGGKPSLHNQRLGLIRPRDGATVDLRFIYYLFNTPDVRAQIRATASGIKVRHTAPSRIAAVRVSIPPFATQRRIASMLGTYDDLIEVNRRRIAILEEMARRLFEEWFVHFRFPGHPRHSPPEAQGGLPRGWNEVPLDEMLVLQRGFDLPTASRHSGPFPVIAATGVHGTHVEAKVKGPGVTTGRSGTIGTVLLVHEDFWPLNTVLYVREFRKASPAYALYLLRHLDLKARAGGAAVPTLNRNHIHSLKVPCPPLALVEQFENQAMNWLRLVKVLERQGLVLAAARDLLLPRLVSGELSIVAAERELGAAA